MKEAVPVKIVVLVVSVAKVFRVIVVAVVVSAAAVTTTAAGAKCDEEDGINDRATSRRRRGSTCSRRSSHLLRGDRAATRPRCLAAASDTGSA